VADEVGLGKTLVARGVIARAIDHLWDSVPRIDVVYICSNAQIARQNINRLNITGDEEYALASRITLLPKELGDLQRRRINFISFTPGTSFELRSSMGKQDERILLYSLLKAPWELQGSGPLNLFQGSIQDKERFRESVRAFQKTVKIDPAFTAGFERQLAAHIEKERASGRPDLRSRFAALCERFHYARLHVPAEDRRERNQLVGELRMFLAAACLRELQPDLVILDEFQRFKHLLSGDDEGSLLARELFDYADDHNQVRVLLLSATPYKMYTLQHEQTEDDHYEDFLRTVDFLDPSPACSLRFREALARYRRGLYRLGDGQAHDLLAVKQELGATLRRVMARTERIRSSEAGDGMLREVGDSRCLLRPEDARDYVGFQRIADHLEERQVVEYWKSIPYLLNFMEEYELKRSFRGALERANTRMDLARELEACREVLLPWSCVHAYEPLSPSNPRLRTLLAALVESGAWRLLWLPPTLPYHELGEGFEALRARGFTKRLVFSTWMAAPKAISTLVSYEVERFSFRAAEASPQNTAEARKRRRGLLRFTSSEGRLTGMPVLGLLYPSVALAALGDPLALLRERFQGRLPALAELRGAAEDRLRPEIEALTTGAPTGGDEDESWYWAVPILLDRQRDKRRTDAWWRRDDLDRVWVGGEDAVEEGEDEAGSRFSDHLDRARRVLTTGTSGLGRPPRDLLAVTALLALAGPGTVALRSFAQIAGAGASPGQALLHDAAAQVAWSLRALFNQPEAMAVLRAGATHERYWQRVLEYSLEGGLQAVLDEYVHVLRDLDGLFDRAAEDVVPKLAERIREVIALRTSTLRVDEIRLDGSLSLAPQGLRGHFALRLGSESSEEGAGAVREESVRAAFNSPFRPFVLATTSVGQEGLDFHPYCHAVVHWNLPANPVDLEQREGRVHRYKGHAIRKNVAQVHGARALAERAPDPWQHIFELARAEASDPDNGLVPYWVYTAPGGAAIERHVPALPLSRDRAHLEALRRSLAVYRMVFGQPRQDDLLAYLVERVPAGDLERLRPLLRIDLAPPRSGTG
jgi:hypothetical protein